VIRRALPWICERSLLGSIGPVWSLAGWQDKVASGSFDGGIRVWDVGTGAHDATLAGHSRGVTALVVHGDRLLSSSGDGTIRAWAVRQFTNLIMDGK
jgi:WD40 repeat protein